MSLSLSFLVWVTLLNMFLSDSLHLPANFILFTTEYYPRICMSIPTVRLSVEGHLTYFHLLAILNKIATNFAEQVSVE